MSCPSCGFDPADLGPLDAVAALRSFPRRFEVLLEPDDPEADGRSAEAIAAARPAVLAEAEAAAGDIAHASGDLRRVLVEDEPLLTSSPAPGPPNTAPDDAVEHVRAAATATAGLAEDTHGEAWKRRGRRGSSTVTALDLLREAVHAGAHHLRAATRAAGVSS